MLEVIGSNADVYFSTCKAVNSTHRCIWRVWVFTRILFIVLGLGVWQQEAKKEENLGRIFIGLARGFSLFGFSVKTTDYYLCDVWFACFQFLTWVTGGFTVFHIICVICQNSFWSVTCFKQATEDGRMIVFKVSKKAIAVSLLVVVSFTEEQ